MSRSSLSDVVRDPSVPLEELALTISGRFSPVDIPKHRRRLDRLSQGLDLPQDDPFRAAHDLRALLFDTHRFEGNPHQYYDPDNSHLHTVLSTRRGLPLSLSLIYAAIARRGGGHVAPIGFPGHVIIRHGSDPYVYQDPYHAGRVLGTGELNALAARFLGGADNLRPAHLEPMDRAGLASRIVLNLRNAYERRGDRARSMIACDLMVELTGTPEARRDRGRLAASLGAYAIAYEDLSSYLEARPDAPDAAEVLAALGRLSRSHVVH